MVTASLLLDDVTPPGRLPLYAGVLTTISLAVSSGILLMLAPVLEHVGFTLLFVTVLTFGILSLLINLFVFRRGLKKRLMQNEANDE